MNTPTPRPAHGVYKKIAQYESATDAQAAVDRLNAGNGFEAYYATPFPGDIEELVTVLDRLSLMQDFEKCSIPELEQWLAARALVEKHRPQPGIQGIGFKTFQFEKVENTLAQSLPRRRCLEDNPKLSDR